MTAFAELDARNPFQLSSRSCEDMFGPSASAADAASAVRKKPPAILNNLAMARYNSSRAILEHSAFMLIVARL